MGISVDEILGKITDAAEGAFKDGWQAVKTYAPAEFKKMSIQLAEIVENVALYEADNNQGYSSQTGRVLFKMQRAACVSVLVAVTHLTLITVQKAIDAILKILRDTFSGIIAAIV
jgi:hypothetical protein